jgi:hypothetical protein
VAGLGRFFFGGLLEFLLEFFYGGGDVNSILCKYLWGNRRETAAGGLAGILHK